MGNSLISAARDGDLEKVKKCCADSKCDINHQDNEHGVTALMEASHAGHLKVVSFLISQNADVNLISKHGVPAVVYAATQNQAPVVQFLVAHGADPKPVNFIKKEIKFDYPDIQEATRKGLESLASGQTYWIHETNSKIPASPNRTPDKLTIQTPPSNSLIRQNSSNIIVKPNQLKTTTAVLKQEVEKLKTFMASAGAIQEELDELKIDYENAQLDLEEKNNTIVKLTAKLKFTEENSDRGSIAALEPPDWMKDRENLLQTNKNLQDELYNLKETQKRFAAAVVDMRQENDELRAKLNVYTGSDDEDEPEDGEDEHR